MNTGTVILTLGGVVLWLWGMNQEGFTFATGGAVFLGAMFATVGILTLLTGK